MCIFSIYNTIYSVLSRKGHTLLQAQPFLILLKQSHSKITFYTQTTFIHYSNPSLPSGSSPASFSSGSYILPSPVAHIFHNAGNNEHDPLSYPSYIVRRIHNIGMVFVYLLPLNQSFLFKFLSQIAFIISFSLVIIFDM